MGPIRNALAAFLLAIAAASPARAADPFITVMPSAEDRSLAFWLLDMNSQPSGATIAGLSLAQVNLARERGQAPWCAAALLGPASFTSSDPAVRQEIAQYLRGPDGNIFRATTNMTGAPLLAVVGSARTCRGEIAPFILLVDQSRPVPRVAYVRTFLGWTPFLSVRADRNRLVVTTCLECDHGEILSWNRRARRFVWRSEGAGH